WRAEAKTLSRVGGNSGARKFEAGRSGDGAGRGNFSWPERATGIVAGLGACAAKAYARVGLGLKRKILGSWVWLALEGGIGVADHRLGVEGQRGRVWREEAANFVRGLELWRGGGGLAGENSKKK
ncbi:hypothetical protein, partial [Campylobacter sp.]|uniref:hypothetical protein n=1 Tax=Campylobacter sp. TaxID=205 RepID=UPI0026DAF7BA